MGSPWTDFAAIAEQQPNALAALDHARLGISYDFIISESGVRATNTGGDDILDDVTDQGSDVQVAYVMAFYSAATEAGHKTYTKQQSDGSHFVHVFLKGSKAPIVRRTRQTRRPH